jgi:hypothetical protein
MQEAVSPRQPRPTTPADLHRLAALAQARGLRLTQEQPTVWYCSSASQHGEPHYVTGLSCDCRGFQEHQRCSHYALLLEHLGWLPEVEGELSARTEVSPHGENLTSADCPDCCGCGLQDFGRYTLPCETCGGSGVKPDHHLHDAPPVQPAAAA